MGYSTRQVTVGAASSEILAQKASRIGAFIRIVSGGDIRIGPPTVTIGGTPATAGLLIKATDTVPFAIGSQGQGTRMAAADSMWAIRDAAADSVVSIMEIT